MTRDSKIGVMVCGHGTRDAAGVAQFANMANGLRERFPAWRLEHGYLEFARPLISDGLDALKASGVEKILAVPGLLFAAGHAKNDIPALLNNWSREQNGAIDVRYGRELGLTADILQAAHDRVAESLASLPERAMSDTLLVTVGRGSSDPDANGNIAKVSRLLQEYFGFGWSMAAYSGVTFPLVIPALEHATRLGFGRIVVFPYFLFTGRLIERIYAHTDDVASRHPGVEFVKALYLGDHPGVVRSFEARVLEILDGRPEMNCQLCKYRTALPSFEGEVGMPQTSHHHHVEGIGTDNDDDAKQPSALVSEDSLTSHDVGSSEQHPLMPAGAARKKIKKVKTDDKGGAAPRGVVDSDGDNHTHDHSHHPPYPHKDHPFGPRSLPS
ncbi:MAG: sirohydrochlorin chelatase [Alphaproteobacteria bacterium]|nr:sirohydrochlorin chelatase [Alphaproteobacteria bacterium]MDA8004053.1 sirohydrochlorin chelatase [Alphaproteobacteria bacterium]MDA8005705.1 sirohydrochlorin chelatase [Alphaproteobacteria bacterium]MDA8013058.1 sirohydrochlorin chelatase [Alphaproteobacteria bacterium]